MQQDHIYLETKELGAKASTTPKNKRGNNQRANVTRQFIEKDVRNIFALWILIKPKSKQNTFF